MKNKAKIQSTMMFLVFLLAMTVGLTWCESLKSDCNPMPLIAYWEGRKPCVYLDSKGIKTIGVGYNMNNKDAPAVFLSIGADFETFYNSPVTPAKHKCKCKKVPCLTNEQVELLFRISVNTAIRDAAKVISTFSSLCCSVQNVMVDMAFTLGLSRFLPFTTFSSLVEREYWKAAGDDLTVSKWCVHDSPKRCLSDAATVSQGCGCSGSYPQACDVQASSCCASAAQQTCCRGNLTFSSKYARRTFEELLCCPVPKASCCTHNKCCRSQTPICCPNAPAVPTYCCPAGFPICKNGECYREDGAVVLGEPSLSP